MLSGTYYTTRNPTTTENLVQWEVFYLHSVKRDLNDLVDQNNDLDSSTKIKPCFNVLAQLVKPMWPSL